MMMSQARASDTSIERSSASSASMFSRTTSRARSLMEAICSGEDGTMFDSMKSPFHKLGGECGALSERPSRFAVNLCRI